ncbi:MAG: aldose epimerase family protein [Rhodospirillales bacterium]
MIAAMRTARQPMHFGDTPDGARVDLVRLHNGGAAAALMTWGASLQDFRLDGLARSLVLGSPVFDPYPTRMRHYGAIAGPVANRIGGGRFSIDGRSYDLEKNEKGTTTLHGAGTGTGIRNWRLDGYDGHRCAFVLRHANGESGFPGNLDIRALYSLGDDGALRLDIDAVTDAPTFCNLAHHSYWNLDGSVDLSAHRLSIAAESYLPVDDRLLPLGDPEPVAGTRFDYRSEAPVLDVSGRLLDHNFCLGRDTVLKPACLLAAGGVRLAVSTTEPGLQVYDGTGIDTGAFAGHGGKPYRRHAGLAIEPQNWPDAPNRPGYPPSLLRPGETYSQTSVFHATRAST